MKVVITYKDQEDKIHQDRLETALDTAYIVNPQGQEVEPNTSEFQVRLKEFYEDIGCDHVEIKEET